MASTRKASESGEREGVERERAAHAVVSGEHGENERKHTRPRSAFDGGSGKVEESGLEAQWIP